MKYLLITTDSNSVINFRSNFIKFLQNEGHQVVVISQDDYRSEEIKELGCSLYCVKQDNRSINPFAIFRYQKELKKIIKKEMPDVVFTFQVKPNSFGIPIAKKLKIKKVFGMIEGLGDVYVYTGIKWSIIRAVVNFMYKRACKKADKIFFLNNYDKQEFIDRKLISPEKCELINGIGVDLVKFSYKPIKNYNNFIMIARMLETKGVLDFCKCARFVRQKYPNATFTYLGSEGTIKVSQIQEYIDDGSIKYLGTSKDVRPYIEDSTAFILPSYYREGCPMSIMEAEAMGRAIITTDMIGCKDTVVNEHNGYIVSKNDYLSIAQKVIWLIDHPEEVEVMGKNSRLFAETHYDSNKINAQIYNSIK